MRGAEGSRGLGVEMREKPRGTGESPRAASSDTEGEKKRDRLKLSEPTSRTREGTAATKLPTNKWGTGVKRACVNRWLLP